MKAKYLFIILMFYGFTLALPLYAIPHRFIDDAQEFETMLTYTQKPIFVNFSAPWCGVCNTFKDTFTKLTDNQLFKDTIMFITVHFDKAKAICDKYKVDRIPTFLYIQDGNILRKDIGIKRGIDVKDFFEKTLTETFTLDNSVKKTVSHNQSTLKSTVAYFVTPPLRYIKDGIEWCLKKLST